MANMLYPCVLLAMLLLAEAVPMEQERGLIFNLDAGELCLLYGVYYKCPCESGLICDADKSIVGAITNTEFGICGDPAEAK
ncbi:PREDICTED: colipase [Nestor notabilis]|uniref:colipase n=1 Tax=Nestor notabilis TaxID=176057 RepID=UPI0005231765|nr:PREDICTED: colipase [Nestor notabilis]